MQSLNAKLKKLLSIHRYFKEKFTIFDFREVYAFDIVNSIFPPGDFLLWG